MRLTFGRADRSSMSDIARLIHSSALVLERIHNEEARRNEFGRTEQTEHNSSMAAGRPQLTGDGMTFLRELMTRSGELLALLTVLGFICYAITWSGYLSFYYRLGVKPSEVGISYSAIVSRAAIMAVVIGALVLIAISAIVLMLLPTRYSESARLWRTLFLPALLALAIGFLILDNSKSDLAKLVGACIELFGGVLLVIAISNGLVRAYARIRPRLPSRWWVPVAVAAALSIAGVRIVGDLWPSQVALLLMLMGISSALLVILALRFGEWTGELGRSFRRRFRAKGRNANQSQSINQLVQNPHARGGMVIGVLLLSIALSLSFLAAFNESLAAGDRAASRMEYGQNPNEGYASTLLEFEAPKVELKWLNQRYGKELPLRAFYLGTSNGQMIIYDPKECRAMRIPPGIVIATSTDEELESCHP
jgi:hypothetical protein